MANLNTVVLIGRMTKDPELRTTASGLSVASFTLAINRFVGQGKEPATDFIPVNVWGKQAENVNKYCSKGSQIGIEGRIQSRRYTDKQGNNKTVIEVVADTTQFLDPKPQNAAPAAQPVPEAEESSEDMMPPLDITEDDLPF